MSALGDVDEIFQETLKLKRLNTNDAGKVFAALRKYSNSILEIESALKGSAPNKLKEEIRVAKENRRELRTLLTDPAVTSKSFVGLDRDTDNLIRTARDNLFQLIFAINRL